VARTVRLTSGRRIVGGRCATLDELRTAVRTFERRLNAQWRIERHGYRTPTEAREHLTRQAAMA
jgi:hypothetical protein